MRRNRSLPLLDVLQVGVSAARVFARKDHRWILDGAREALESAELAAEAGAWTAEALASAVLSIETVIAGQGPTGAEVEPGEAKAIARGLATLAGVIVRLAQAGRS